MTRNVENMLFYGIPAFIVLIIVLLFLFRTPRHEAGRKEMAPVYKLVAENNYAKAIPMAGKMARLNNCDAQFFLYKLYIEGKHVKKNEEAALRWLQESARSGHPAAQHYWGLHLMKTNPEKAEYYLKSARKAGFKEK